MSGLWVAGLRFGTNKLLNFNVSPMHAIDV